jgi:hypothetical protein
MPTFVRFARLVCALLALGACTPAVLVDKDFAPIGSLPQKGTFRGTLVLRPVDMTLGCTDPGTVRTLLVLRTDRGYLPLSTTPAECVRAFALKDNRWVSGGAADELESLPRSCYPVEPLDASALAGLGAHAGDEVTLAGVLGPVFAKGGIASYWVTGLYVDGKARR